MFHARRTHASPPAGAILRGCAHAAGRHVVRALAAAGGSAQLPAGGFRTLPTEAFTDAMAELVSGVCVITACGRDGAPHGLVATSVCSYSDDPPAILVCVGSHGRARVASASAPGFGVHVLGDEQGGLARWFATHGTDTFAAVDWSWDHGVPALADVVVYLRCTRAAVKRHGDHVMVIGEIEHVETAPGEPLVYLRRRMGWRLDDAAPA